MCQTEVRQRANKERIQIQDYRNSGVYRSTIEEEARARENKAYQGSDNITAGKSQGVRR